MRFYHTSPLKFDNGQLLEPRPIVWAHRQPELEQVPGLFVSDLYSQVMGWTRSMKSYYSVEKVYLYEVEPVGEVEPRHVEEGQQWLTYDGVRIKRLVACVIGEYADDGWPLELERAIDYYKAAKVAYADLEMAQEFGASDEEIWELETEVDTVEQIIRDIVDDYEESNNAN